MRNLAILACALILSGCDCAGCFKKGDESFANVQLDGSDKCIVHVTVHSVRMGEDVGLNARIISPECNK